MIPLPYGLSPRLVGYGVVVAIILALFTSTTVYRALYRSAKTQATEQLSAAASESARLTAEALHRSYADRMAQIEADRALSDRVAKDAVARAQRAETALTRLRRNVDAEALEDACVGRPLSERTRERLRELEASYSGHRDEVRTDPDPR